MLKIGILGCGKIAQDRHIPEYAKNDNCELIGFYNPSAKKAEDMAARYGGAVCSSIEELLAMKPDAVSVCLANVAHAPASIAALEAGAHVLCEKPMATNLEEAEAMVEAAERNKKILMVAYNLRFEKTSVKAKELLDAGAIGRLLSFNISLRHAGPDSWLGQKDTWFFDKETAILGVMGDLGSHKTDLLRFLTGQRVVETMAKIKTLDKTKPDGSPISVDDNAICVYTLESGAIGTLCASWTHYGSCENDVTALYGTEGVLRIYGHPEYSLSLERKDGSVERFAVDAPAAESESSGVIDYFVDCILKGEQPHINGAEALLSERVLSANTESAKTQREVVVEYR